MPNTQRDYGIRHVLLDPWLRVGHNWGSADDATRFTEEEAEGLAQRLNARPCHDETVAKAPYYVYLLPTPEEGANT